MKLREKFRRFWTMDVHNHEGFTLVELIIVIAILAILSGVAVVGYSSYVKKANMAADKTLVAELVNVLTLAHYDKPLEGAVTIVLRDNGAQIVSDGNTLAETWVNDVLTAAYGANYADLLKPKYTGWGNGVAMTNAMLDKLQNDPDIKAAMDKLYNNPDGLSFTNEIPTLMDEIKNLAVEVGGSEEGAVDTVTLAAALTSAWTVSDVQDLWKTPIGYVAKTEQQAAHYDVTIDNNTAWDDAGAKVQHQTIAGLLRAKNTCLALYAKNNMTLSHPTGKDLYTALSTFSVKNANTPLDLTKCPERGLEFERLKEVLELDLTVPSHQAYLAELAGLLATYTSGANETVANNDAATYAAMMGIVEGIASDSDTSVSDMSFEEYFNAATGAVTLFQQLILGNLDITNLSNAMANAAGDGANVSITLIPNGSELEIIVGPPTVLG